MGRSHGQSGGAKAFLAPSLKFIADSCKTLKQRDTFVTTVHDALGENILNSRLYQSTGSSVQASLSDREDFSEYVAHLQLHMALQARNLVPTLAQQVDSREQFLYQTQADIEKFVSRQRP